MNFDYDKKRGIDTLTKVERMRLAEKMIDQLRSEREPLTKELSNLNNRINYWQRVLITESYYIAPVEICKPKLSRKERKDKGFTRKKKINEESLLKAWSKMNSEEKSRVIRRLK